MLEPVAELGPATSPHTDTDTDSLARPPRSTSSTPPHAPTARLSVARLSPRAPTSPSSTVTLKRINQPLRSHNKLQPLPADDRRAHKSETRSYCYSDTNTKRNLVLHIAATILSVREARLACACKQIAVYSSAREQQYTRAR